MDKQFFQITLPIVFSIFAAVWSAVLSNNKRLDDIIERLLSIETKLEQAKR